MADIICPNCKTEYYLHVIKMPIKDEAGTLYCKCETELYSYPKGTRDYRLEECGVYHERMKQQQDRIEWEEANYPKCKCKVTMVKRKGAYGEFFGCRKFPNGCNDTKKVPAKLKGK